MFNSYESALLCIAALFSFLDWYIGPEGRKRLLKRVRDWLDRLKLVTVSTFGIDEVQFAYSIVVRVFSPRFFSTRRFFASLILALFVSALLTLGCWEPTLGSRAQHVRFDVNLATSICVTLMLALSYSIAISLTLISLKACEHYASRFGKYTLRIWLGLFVIQTSLIGVTASLTTLVIESIRNEFFRLAVAYTAGGFKDIDWILRESWTFDTEQRLSLLVALITKPWNIPIHTVHMAQVIPDYLQCFSDPEAVSPLLHVAPHVPNLLRLMIAVFFVGCLLFRPLIKPVATQLLRRFVAMRQGILTVVAVACAALAEILS